MRMGDWPRSSLDTPLNSIFSSEANVRVLRELVLARAPLSKAEIARRTGVSLPGVLKTLPRLVATGVVKPVGTGSRHVYTIRDAHPLTGALEFLFRTESLQKEQLTAELARVVERSPRPIRSAWVDESRRDSPSAPVPFHVLVSSADVRVIQDTLRAGLAELSVTSGMVIELHVLTAPDLAALSLEKQKRLLGVMPLHGPNPLVFLESRADAPKARKALRTHADREAEALKRALWIVRMLDRDPALPERARDWVVHRLRAASPREHADLQEWLDLLSSASIATLQYILLRVDERSDRLRQTNPFIMVLSRDEKARMVEEVAR